MKSSLFFWFVFLSISSDFIFALIISSCAFCSALALSSDCFTELERHHQPHHHLIGADCVSTTQIFT